MNVPFIDLKRHPQGFVDAVVDDYTHILKTTAFVGGPLVEKTERELAEKLAVNHVIGCANGTDAIQLALRAMGVGPGHRVLVPDMTFWATLEAVVNVGATPVLIPINPETGHSTLAHYEQALANGTVHAATMVHLFGWANPDTVAIRSLLESKKIPLIEDGAQAFGVEINGRPLFSGAQIATLSFYPAKVLGASADSGAVVCQNAALAKIVRQLGNHGRYNHYEYEYVGWNSRMGGLNATYLSRSLKFIDEKLRTLRTWAERYRSTIQNPVLTHLAPSQHTLENGYLHVALIDSAHCESFRAYLKNANIGFGQVYPSALSSQSRVAQRFETSEDCRGTSDFCSRVINLPVFFGLQESEFEYVVNTVNQYR